MVENIENRVRNILFAKLDMNYLWVFALAKSGEFTLYEDWKKENIVIYFEEHNERNFPGIKYRIHCDGVGLPNKMYYVFCEKEKLNEKLIEDISTLREEGFKKIIYLGEMKKVLN